MAVSKLLEKGYAVQLEPDRGGTPYKVEVKHGDDSLVSDPKFLRSSGLASVCDSLVQQVETQLEAQREREAAAKQAALEEAEAAARKAAFNKAATVGVGVAAVCIVIALVRSRRSLAP